MLTLNTFKRISINLSCCVWIHIGVMSKNPTKNQQGMGGMMQQKMTGQLGVGGGPPGGGKAENDKK